MPADITAPTRQGQGFAPPRTRLAALSSAVMNAGSAGGGTVSERFAQPYGISMGRATMTPLCVRTLAT